jgi:hypothetical protein
VVYFIIISAIFFNYNVIGTDQTSRSIGSLLLRVQEVPGSNLG